jgi:hypothetical protein
MSKEAQIQEARQSGDKAGEWIEASGAFPGALGEKLLNLFADCIVDAHLAPLAQGAEGSAKWSVTLEWTHGLGSGLLHLNFGNVYLFTHRHGAGFFVCLDRTRVTSGLQRLLPSDTTPAFPHQPNSVLLPLDAAAVRDWSKLRPAFQANCANFSEAYKKLHPRAYPEHSPGVIQYLRKRLNRPNIPDPGWATVETPQEVVSSDE